ncbi:hypothetical protein [Bradyrhizobium sp. BR 1433]|uniref:hypothetical protein n=1 Tax=Bradyrhizobium sp. BR 1433 TaxID=3447967 RepID=UPI003EE533E7
MKPFRAAIAQQAVPIAEPAVETMQADDGFLLFASENGAFAGLQGKTKQIMHRPLLDMLSKARHVSTKQANRREWAGG